MAFCHLGQLDKRVPIVRQLLRNKLENKISNILAFQIKKPKFSRRFGGMMTWTRLFSSTTSSNCCYRQLQMKTACVPGNLGGDEAVCSDPLPKEKIELYSPVPPPPDNSVNTWRRVLKPQGEDHEEREPWNSWPQRDLWGRGVIQQRVDWVSVSPKVGQELSEWTRWFFSRPYAAGSWQKVTSPLTTSRIPTTYSSTAKGPTN